jgi:hypothetical protein
MRSAIWSASVSRSSAGMVVPCGLFYIESVVRGWQIGGQRCSMMHVARM